MAELLELLVDFITLLFPHREPFRDPERNFGGVFLGGMLLLLTAGLVAIVFLLRQP